MIPTPLFEILVLLIGLVWLWILLWNILPEEDDE